MSFYCWILIYMYTVKLNKFQVFTPQRKFQWGKDNEYHETGSWLAFQYKDSLINLGWDDWNNLPQDG